MRITKPVWWSASAIGLAGYLVLWPTHYRVPCLFRLCTGLQCPGCGTTRAISALLRGDLVAAFNFNQLIWFIPIFALTVKLSSPSKFAPQIQVGITILAVLVALGFFLVRNNFI